MKKLLIFALIATATTLLASGPFDVLDKTTKDKIDQFATANSTKVKPYMV